MPALAPRAAEAPRAVTPGEIYWKNQADQAFKERDAIKASLVATDGPAAHWRGQAKEANKKLGDANRRLDGVRRAEQEQRDFAIRFSEEADAMKREIGRVKQQLWAVWSALDDADPTKRSLWEIWGAL